MYKLYFENSEGRRTWLDNVSTEQEIWPAIHAELRRMNPNFIVNYIRSWREGNIITYDVGSHSEFFIAEEIKYYLVEEKELIRLLRDSHHICALRDGGVDNWESYGWAMSEYMESGIEDYRLDPEEDYTLKDFALLDLKSYEEYDYETLAQLNQVITS